MKWEKVYSSNTMKFIINLLRVSVILISYRIASIPQLPKWVARPSLGTVRSVANRSTPAFKTLAAGAIIPFMIGYGVRKFEDYTEFTGRDGFHDNPRQDLLKMAHYAFHTGAMATSAWLGWSISSGLADDTRVASLLGGIYFYAIGRQFIMHPAESHLTIRIKYIPAACIALMAISRTPALQKYFNMSATLLWLGASFHILGFH